MKEIIIRQMRDSDLEPAMRLKEAELWNQAEADWHFLLHHNPELCLVAILGNEVIGTVTAINYQNKIAWIGMMLVSSGHRRKGVSSALLKDIIERLEGCNCIKLDATPSGVHVYQKLGFEEEFGLHRISAQAIRPIQEAPFDGRIERITESDLSEISEMDEQVFGANRIGLIQYLKGNLTKHCWVIRNNRKSTGFVLGRKGTRFTHLGPIVAKSIEDAKALVTRVTRYTEGKPVLMDVPTQNVEWQRWLAGLGFSCQRSFSRMYLKRNIRGENADNIFAIGGPEIG